ncbi:MAG: class I SAM-dependent methyltransferase [Aureliella sp.]
MRNGDNGKPTRECTTSESDKPLAYEAYQALADHYAAGVDTKPHNAYYERPAMVEMWPDLTGKRVLDAGCGPGAYHALLKQRGAEVISVDASDRMLELARERLGNDADLRRMDLSKPLPFDDDSFDFVNAPLCMDYIEDWTSVFTEFRRVLAANGAVQFSCGHPAFEVEYYKSNRYFEVEQVECTWTGFGKAVVMPSYRRSLQAMFSAPIEAGLRVTQVVEPLPTDDFQRADPVRYARLLHRPAFICIQATKKE